MNEPPRPSGNTGGDGPRCEKCGSTKFTRITGYNQEARKIKIHCDDCGSNSEVNASY